MFSRTFLGVLCVCAALAPLAGCSLRLKAPDTKPKLLHVDPGGGCLDKAGAVLDAYFQGTLSAEDHEGFFSCVHMAFTTFSEYADGKNRDSFEPSELGNFFTKYFLNGKAIPPALQAELMALKYALIGGSAERVTRQELRRILHVIDTLKGVTSSLRPYMPFDAASFAERRYDPEQFDAAMKTFLEATAVFGREVQDSQGSYSFDRIPVLVRELSAYLYDGNPPQNSWPDMLLKYADAVRPAKAILISPPKEGITAQDWPKVYRLAPRYFALYSRFQFYKVTPVDYLYGVGLARLETFTSELLDLYQAVLAARPGGQISSDEIDDLLAALARAKILPVSKDQAHSYLQLLFGRILGSTPVRGNKFSLGPNSLSRLAENARFALEGLRANETLFRSLLGDSAFLSQSLKREEIAAVPSATLLGATVLKNRLSLEAVEAVKRTPFEIGTVFQRDSMDVVIPKSGATTRVSHSHMAKVHVLRTVNRLLLQSYGSQRSSRLSDSQIDSILSEIFPMLEQLGILTPDLRESVKKRVFEASLFLYSSDGQPGISMNEALELEALVLATFDRASRIHGSLTAACPRKPENPSRTSDRAVSQEMGALVDLIDQKPAQLVEPACYRKTFVDRQRELWSFLPGLSDFLASQPRAAQDLVFSHLEGFLRKGIPATDYFSLGDTRAFVLMPYYVEILYARFDRNRDGRIDTAEGDVAYPVFHPFIAKKAGEKGYNSNEDHAAIYNYLLANRQLPTDDAWDFAIHRYLTGRQEFSVDRGQMVEIFEKLLSL